MTAANPIVTVLFDNPSSEIRIVDRGTSAILAQQTGSDTASVRIAGRAGADHVTVNLTLPFDSPVFFTEDPSALADGDKLSVLGLPEVIWTLSALDEGSVAAAGGISFLGIENLSGDVANRDTFILAEGALLTGAIDAGAVGFDALDQPGARCPPGRASANVFQFVQGGVEPATPSFSVPYANLTSIIIDVTGNGRDDVTVDGVFGSVVTTNAKITVNGGGGGGNDRLFIKPTADANDVVFAGDVTGTLAAGSQTSVLVDAFGDTAGQSIAWTSLDTVDKAVVAVASVEGIGNGLQAFADALSAQLGESVEGQALPGVSAQSLTSALNGVLLDSLRAKDQALVASTNVPGSDQIQIDGASSVLLRLLQAGGLDISALTSGTINGLLRPHDRRCAAFDHRHQPDDHGRSRGHRAAGLPGRRHVQSHTDHGPGRDAEVHVWRPGRHA